MANRIIYRVCSTVLLTIAVLFAVDALAAKVPVGTKLAERQELVRSNGSDPATLDPQVSETAEAANIIIDSFAGLVSLDASGNVQPELAVSWQNDQNKIWTFHLRPGVKWSNGEPITADDVVYSWQRLADPKLGSPNQAAVRSAHLLNADAVIKGKLPTSSLGVKALDPATLQVTLSQPSSFFLQMVSSTEWFSVNPRVVKQYGEEWTQPEHIVVSGAYKPQQWIINERFISLRNPAYWNDAQTVINQVTYLPITEPSAVLNRYRSGEIDITDQIPSINYPNLKQTMGDQIVQTPILGIYFYVFNLQKPPYDDLRVRQALSLGLDRSIITDKVIGMGQKPAFTMTPLNMGGMKITAPPHAKWSQEQRTQQAKKLLAEAGYSATHPLRVTLLYNTSQDHQRIAIAIASIWKKQLGVQVELQNQEWKTLVQNMHAGDFTLARMTWLSTIDDPISFTTLYLSDDAQNLSHYRSPRFDELHRRASEQSEITKTQEYLQQLSDLLASDLPAIPIYYSVQNQLVKPWVGGMKVRPTSYYPTQEMYIKAH